MREVTKDDRIMRQFLLDNLGEEERERVEEQFMIDAAFREKLLIAEENLIEEYLDNLLSESERNQFHSIFLSSPQQREKVTLARVIAAHAKAEVDSIPREDEVVRKTVAGTKAALDSKNNRRMLLIAAAVLIAIFATLWLIYRSPTHESAEEGTRRSAIQTELAELNSGSSSGSRVLPAETISLVLAPVNTRASGPPTVSRSTVLVVEFWLLPTSLDNAKFKALITKDGDRALFEVSNLPLEDKREGRAVRLRVPIRLLDQGAYRIELRAVSPNGDAAYVGEYRFQVVD